MSSEHRPPVPRPPARLRGSPRGHRGTGTLRRASVALAAVALFSAVNSAAQPPATSRPTIVVGGDYRYEPFEWLDEHGEPQGFHVELMRAMGEEMGFEVTFRLDAWDQVRKDLERGRIDVAPMFRSAERERLMDFTKPHAILDHQLFVRTGAGAGAVRSPGDLGGKAVIVQRGAFTHDRLRKLSSGTRLILVSTEADAMRLLASGRHDAALVTGSGGRSIIRRDGLSNVEAAGPPFWPREYALAVRKGEAELLDQLNRGLEALRRSGRYDEVYGRWLAPPGESEGNWKTAFRYSAWVLVPLVLLASAALAWSWTLRRQIAVRTRELEHEAGERKRAEEELLQVQKMEAVSRLAGGVAHDFNNLLTVILGESDFALGDTTLQGTARLSVEEIRRTAERATALTRQLLAFCRRDLVEPTLFQLRDLVENVLRMVSRLCGERVRMTTRFAEDSRAVRTDRGQIEQVLVNLVINSCHAMPAAQALFSQPSSHVARGVIGQKPHRVQRFPRRARADQHAHRCQACSPCRSNALRLPVSVKELAPPLFRLGLAPALAAARLRARCGPFRRNGRSARWRRGQLVDHPQNLIDFRQVSDSLIAASKLAYVRAHKSMAQSLQGCDVPLHGGMLPHVHVHGRSNQHLGPCCQKHARKHVIGYAVGHLSDDVCSRWRNQHQPRSLGKRGVCNGSSA